MIQYTEEQLNDLTRRGYNALVMQIKTTPDSVLKEESLSDKFRETFQEMEARGVDFSIGQRPIKEMATPRDKQVLSDIAQGKHLRVDTPAIRKLYPDELSGGIKRGEMYVQSAGGKSNPHFIQIEYSKEHLHDLRLRGYPTLVEVIQQEMKDQNLIKRIENHFEKNEFHKCDNSKQIFFYEQDFYVFSNFSSFQVMWDGPEFVNNKFQTSEHLYHCLKFINHSAIVDQIQNASSAHDAFIIAQENKQWRHPDWDDVKVSYMERIIELKTMQHPYIFKKLHQSIGRELIEDSWRDDYWGWGPNKDGLNMLGKCWMRLRDKIFSNNDEVKPNAE